MSSLHNLKPYRVVKAFERAVWTLRGQKGSHIKLTKQGLLRDQIIKAGLTAEEFLEFYK